MTPKLCDKYVRDTITKLHPGCKCVFDKYERAKNPLEIICENGHMFKTSYDNITSKSSWCPTCSINSKKLNIYVVKNSILKLHPDCKLLFDKYENNHTKLKIICESGHTFEITYGGIQFGKWCKQCANNKRKNELDYVKNNILKLHPGCELLFNNYTRACEKLKIKCENNHVFEISFGKIKEGIWCKKCFFMKRRKCFSDISLNISNAYPNCKLLSTEYINFHSNSLLIECERKHIFSISYANFSMGKWCPYCLFKNEQMCREIFESLLQVKFVKSRPTFLNGLELDGYNSELKLAFEYNGEQHYMEINHFHRKDNAFEKQKQKDKQKIELCKQHNIQLIIIPYNVKNKEEFIINEILKNEDYYIENSLGICADK